MRKRNLALRGRFWLEAGGESVFGDGRAELLAAIGERGSLNAAARSLKMSYRHAWDHLEKMERGLGLSLVVRATGGRSGGGCRLTPAGKRVLAAYRRFQRQADRQLKALAGPLRRELAAAKGKERKKRKKRKERKKR